MKKALVIHIAILLGISITLNAQIDRSKAPSAGPAPKIVVGSYESFTMNNGLKVIVVENHKLPKVNYTMVFDYTPLFEDNKQGSVAIAGDLLGTGTKNRSKDQINEEIDFIGASLSFSQNGFNASCLTKHNDKLMAVIGDVLCNSVFTQEELDKSKKQYISGLASERKDPGAIAERVSKVFMYGKQHPYGQVTTENSLENIKLEDCNGFYTTYVRPNISYLAIVGDITLAEARTICEKHLGNWSKANVIMPSPEKINTNLPGNVAIVDRPVSVQSMIRVCYPVDLRVGDPDYIKARVANTILGGGTFRLFENLREKHGWTYGAYSQLSPDKLVGNFMATAEVRNSVTDSAITQILYEMKRIGSEPVPQSELSLVKNYVSGTFALSLENPQTIANFALNTNRYNLPADYYQNYLQNIAAINQNDIQTVSRKYITPENATILVVGKAEDIAKSMTALSKNGKVNYYDVDGNLIDKSKKMKAAPAGLTAQQVVENYISAIGGRKNLAKINDITTTMSANMQGMSISIRTINKMPNKMFVEVGSGGMVFSKQIFDGTKALVTTPAGKEELSGQELEDMKNQAIVNVELDYSKYGISLELLGIEPIDGKETYAIQLTYPNGNKEMEYYEITSGLKVRKVGSQGPTDMKDYREVKGILFPFVIQLEMAGQSLKMNVESIELNTKPSDDLFKI